MRKDSEFIVRLPLGPESLAPTSMAAIDARSTPTQSPRPLRVLMVDDNVDTVQSFSVLLRELGHEVETAHDGPEAVRAAIEYQPDVVLLDIGLPGLNGYEVAKQIRRQPVLRNATLVALTGYGQESDQQASIEAGFNHHLIKPARLVQLQQILTSVSETLQ